MPEIARRTALLMLAGGLVAAPAARAEPVRIRVFRSPDCGCCMLWVEHLRRAGFAVDVHDVRNVEPVKLRLGVPRDLYSCHTAVAGPYVIEGHVPAADVARLLHERPAALGLAVPGMPIGSPGMELGAEREPFDVVLFGSAGRSVFARYDAA